MIIHIMLHNETLEYQLWGTNKFAYFSDYGVPASFMYFNRVPLSVTSKSWVTYILVHDDGMVSATWFDSGIYCTYIDTHLYVLLNVFLVDVFL